MQSLPRRLHQAGVSLVETSIVMAVTAVVLGVVTPGFDRLSQGRHLEGSAAQLETDLQFARSLAVARNGNVRVNFRNLGSASCYVVHTGTAQQCSCDGQGAASCSAGAEVLRTVSFDNSGPVQLTSNASSILFDAAQGTVSPTATVRLQARDGRSLRAIVNLMGRVRACSPAPGMPGYPTC